MVKNDQRVLRPGLLRPPDFTANPTAQRIRNLSPPEVSSETGISVVGVGDFREILAKVADLVL
jgi:hypothetical protein